MIMYAYLSRSLAMYLYLGVSSPLEQIMAYFRIIKIQYHSYLTGENISKAPNYEALHLYMTVMLLLKVF